MHKKRILVIDDSEAIHKDFRRILCPEPLSGRDELEDLEQALFGEPAANDPDGKGDFELDSAFQGQEGFSKVQQAVQSGQPYSLAFLDYRMPPGWNGFETLRRLRQVAPSLPVVLCSAYSDYSWEELVREMGGDTRLKELRKPFNLDELQQLTLSLTDSEEQPAS